MDIFKLVDLTHIQWISLVFAAVLIGLSRTAVSGLAMLAIPLAATIFGGQQSTGMILTMLITADIYAILHFRHNANRKVIFNLIPWVIIGLLLALFVGNLIDDQSFKLLIAACIIICLAILIISEVKGDKLKVPEKMWIFALTGIAVGFASMIGNVAGPIFWIYLMAKKFKKKDFLGTVAWFFFIINIIKWPLQLLVWKNISADTILPVLIVAPIIIFSAFMGTILIRKINEKHFRYIVIGMTALAVINIIR